MKSSISGLPSQGTNETGTQSFVTVEHIREKQNALSVESYEFVEIAVASDAVEAGSDDENINATGHVILKGDLIRFTSGSLSGKSARVRSITSVNAVKLSEKLSATPGVGDTFQVLRHRNPVVDTNGRVTVDATISEVAVYNEDTAHTNADPLKAVAAVRSDASAPLAADGDYHPLLVNNLGELKVAATITEVATAADGAAGLPALTKVVSGYDGANVQALHTDASGDLQIDVLTEPATAADGAAGLPAVTKVIAGYDGANVQAIHTDASGDLQTDVLTEPATAADGAAGLPAVTKVIAGYDGANVQAIHTDAAGDLQCDILSLIPGVAATSLGKAEDAAHADGDTGVMSLAVRNDAGAALAGADGDYIPLSTDATGNLRTNLVTALPAGTNNIGDVDVLSIVPGTAATNLGKAEDAAHTSGDVGVMALAVRQDATAASAADGDYTPLQTNANGELKVAATVSQAYLSVVDFLDVPYFDATTINGAAGAFVEGVASLAAQVRKVQVFDTSGAFIGVYTGAAAAETLAFVFGPGSNETIEINIAAATRISFRSLEAAAPSAGNITMNFIG